MLEKVATSEHFEDFTINSWSAVRAQPSAWLAVGWAAVSEHSEENV